MDEKEFLKLIGERIKKARKSAKLTQAELAERVELSSNFIGMAERGERNTKLSNIYKIVTALNCGLEEFFKGI